MTYSPTDFVDSLATVRLKNVFNPYSDHCDIHDHVDAIARRRRNLELSLTAAIELDVRTIWIARDLGYLGGRRTGLALTDEIHLDAYSAMFDGLPVLKATKSSAVGESTARTIWQVLARIAQPIFLWNVFPFHPHEPNDPMSNRCHTAQERDTGCVFLDAIITLLRPDQVLAIGNNAIRAAGCLGVDSIPVRHPSYGGKNIFIKEIEKAYGLIGASNP